MTGAQLSRFGDLVLPASIARSLVGKGFYYPCAGSDWYEPLSLFLPWIDDYLFSDIDYQFNPPKCIPLDPKLFVLTDTSIDGPPHCHIESRVDGAGKRYKDVEPATLVERYLETSSQRVISVRRRRGFGQYALAEIPDGSLGVFFHRGDSLGEGGSGVKFLGNEQARHEPLGNLFKKLTRKLAFPALIVTDGTNTKVPRLRDILKMKEMPGGFPDRDQEQFFWGGLTWTYVAQIGPSRHGPTFVWCVEPATSPRRKGSLSSC